MSFCDNHDVSRVATILQNPDHLPLIYAMLFGMPGIPCIYYGSEWGAQADKAWGDPALRPCFDGPQWNELTGWIAALAQTRKESAALNYGGFRALAISNKACIFERSVDGECVLVCINMDHAPAELYPNWGYHRARDLITGQEQTVDGRTVLPPCYAGFWRIED